MRKIAIAMLVLLSAAACGSARGGLPSGAVSPLALQPPPIYSLFGYRESLELTSAQVEALDSIAQDVKLRNDPVVDTLRAIADARGGRLRGFIPLDETTRPLLERVGTNNQAATAAVQEVLTDDQEAEVCRIVEQPRRDRDRDRERREEEMRRRDPLAADSALYTPLRGVWPWCAGPAVS